MTGYQETLTDPSYAGQIVVMTAPHIGNTGVNDEDPESRRIWVSGYVVRDPCRVVSNYRADGSLDDDLVAEGVVGHQRHRHPRGDPATSRSPAPCAAGCSPARTQLLDADEQLAHRARRGRRWPVSTSRPRSRHADGYVVPATRRPDR